jgi:hypothetical protein
MPLFALSFGIGQEGTELGTEAKELGWKERAAQDREDRIACLDELTPATASLRGRIPRGKKSGPEAGAARSKAPSAACLG